MKFKSIIATAAVGVVMFGVASLSSAATVTATVPRPAGPTAPLLDIGVSNVSIEVVLDTVDATKGTLKLSGIFTPTGGMADTSPTTFFTASLVGIGSPVDGIRPGISDSSLTLPYTNYTPIGTNPVTAWGFNSNASVIGRTVGIQMTGNINDVASVIYILFSFSSNQADTGPNLTRFTFEENAKSAARNLVDIMVVPITPLPTAAASGIALAATQILRRRRQV